MAKESRMQAKRQVEEVEEERQASKTTESSTSMELVFGNLDVDFASGGRRDISGG